MSVLRAWRRFYGENPLHLLAMLGCFALAGYVVTLLWPDPSLVAIAIWFGGAIVAHDLVLYPLYALADVPLRGLRWARRRVAPQRPPLVPAVNHVRVPVLGSALVGLLWLPTLLGGSTATSFAFAAGHPPVGQYENWLLVTGLLFLASAVVYALRLGAAGGRALAARRAEDG